MNERKPVLMTGHRGYLGSVMAPVMLAAGYDVVGLDTGYFTRCSLVPDPVDVPAITKDLRDVVAEDVASFYAVVHLGALSNDPIGNLDNDWTEAINHDATVRLAELSREAGVRRFLFSSSCIMYGMSEAGVVDETSPLDPQTTYAKSKVRSEAALRELASDAFSPTYIRNGTVYGLSPRMRFDTVLNDLVTQAVTTGTVRIHGDGAPWRPVVNVEDVARSFVTYLDAPREVVHDRAFNNGADHLNHQVRELAEFAVAAVEGASIEVLDQATADKRTYKASFARFQETFPDFTWRSARTGAEELAVALAAENVTESDYTGSRYVRLRWLEHLLNEGHLDWDLRWVEER